MDLMPGALTDPAAWLSLATLTLLEVVLGIDNVIFLSIVSGDLPPEKRRLAQRIGLGLALILRIALLTTVTWLAQSTKPLFAVGGFDVSIRDIVLIAGGLFLIWKGVQEIHAMVDDEDEEGGKTEKPARLSMVILEIAALDLVFSLDSIITAVGVSGHLPVMIMAIVIAIFIMLLAANPISDFVGRHPTIKMLALSFIMLVGLLLVADGMGFHIPRGYLYFAIGFSLLVEMLNMQAAKARRRRQAAKTRV